MNEGRKSIYDDLKRELRGFPVDDYVRAYALAFFQGDLETIRKLHELLLGNIAERTQPDSPPGLSPDTPVRAPIKPRPHLNSGAVAVPLPDDSDH